MDTSNWLTKQQAADAIGVTTKSVERWAQAGKLQQSTKRRPDGGPEIVVYHPDDVARLAKERQREAAPFVLPAGADVPSNGNGAHGVEALERVTQPAGDDGLLRALFAAAVQQVMSQTSQTSKLCLTLDEAVAYSGVPRRGLCEFVAAGKLVPRWGRSSRSWRFSRDDLDVLFGRSTPCS